MDTIKEDRFRRFEMNKFNEVVVVEKKVCLTLRGAGQSSRDALECCGARLTAEEMVSM